MSVRIPRALLAIALAVVGTAVVAEPAAAAGPYVRVGYFTQWGIYKRNFTVKNLETSGMAAKLTHINYAFANVGADGKCFEANEAGVGDAWADYQKRFKASESVDGTADAYNVALAGNFGQLRKLKALHPGLRVQLSIGGWTWSKYLSDAALTPASRQAMVASCIDMFLEGNLPLIGSSAQGGPGSGYGVFDGFDLDWEWPASEGNPGNVIRAEDKQNYTLLMQEFRNQLSAVSAQTGKQYLLTIATGASPDLLANKQETKKLSQILDWINVMSYDYHGAFESSTNFQSALYLVTGDPAASSGFYTDGSITKMLELGVTPDKIVVGVPFYGRGWGSVPNVNNGLFQSGAPTMGTWDDGTSGPTGVFDYKDIKRNYENVNGYTKYFHQEAKEAYVYNPNTKIWIAYDDPQSMSAKADYILSKGLGGAMAWELSSDDGSLLDALYAKLK